MNILTEKDINALKDMEIYFKQIEQGYKRASSVKEDIIVADIYERITGKKETNFSCGQCVFKMYKTVAHYYYQALDSIVKDTKTNTKTAKKTDGRKRIKTKKD